MDYLSFIRENRRFLAFGVMTAFFSSAGQTFFISVFSAEIRAEFGLSHGGFGTVYSVATLAAGLTLIWLGRQIDRFDLRGFASVVCIGLAVACGSMAVAPTLALLYAAIFAVRLTGQGLMSHTAVTTMARYFDAGRGKAVGIANMGFPAGEAVFPLTGVMLIAAVGWRGAWAALALALAIGLVPLMLWLLRGHGERHRRHLAGTRDGAAGARPAIRQWTRGEVARDPTFYLILPAVLLHSFVGTGIIFHQIHLVESKGWSVSWFATCFIGLAAATLVSALATGSLIDRFRAARLLPWALAPIGIALLILAGFDHPLSALAFMIVMGLGGGAFRTIGAALWAELYGVTHLGAIRALTAALMVFASAGSPVTMGWLIDSGYSMETIALMCVAYVGVAIALAAIGVRRPLSPGLAPR